MHHLGARRFHSYALAGGQNQGEQWTGSRQGHAKLVSSGGRVAQAAAAETQAAIMQNRSKLRAS